MCSAPVLVICDRFVLNYLFFVALESGPKSNIAPRWFFGTPVERPRAFVNHFLQVGTRVGFLKFLCLVLLNYDRARFRPTVQDMVLAAMQDEGMWWGMGWEERAWGKGRLERGSEAEKKGPMPPHTLITPFQLISLPNRDQTI